MNPEPYYPSVFHLKELKNAAFSPASFTLAFDSLLGPRPDCRHRVDRMSAPDYARAVTKRFSKETHLRR